MASPAIVNFRRGREREREWGWKKNSEEWLTNWLSWVESVSSPKAWLDLRRLLSNNIAGFLPLFLLLLLLISFKMCSFKIYIDYLDRIELVPLPLSFILLNLEYIAQTLRFVCVCVCVCVVLVLHRPNSNLIPSIIEVVTEPKIIKAEEKLNLFYQTLILALFIFPSFHLDST